MTHSVGWWFRELPEPKGLLPPRPTYAGSVPDSGQERLLVDVLSRAQAEGALGQRPIADVIQHARSFVDALPSDVTTVMDIGSGAGVPGLIIALDRPTVQLTLVDRRAKRVDALRRAIAVLEWGDRVVAHEGDVNQLSRDPAWEGTQDAVVARGFGEPARTLPLARQLVRVGGWLVISEPPPERGSRWDPAWVASLGLSSPERCGAVVRFHVEQ